MKKIISILATVFIVTFGLSACTEHDSDVVSRNLSTDADNYKIFRQIVVYNGITDKNILMVEGYCALGNNDSAREVTYTCKTNNGYIKDIIMKSDNTFVYEHQLFPANVSDDYFKVVFKPTTLVPDFELR